MVARRKMLRGMFQRDLRGGLLGRMKLLSGREGGCEEKKQTEVCPTLGGKAKRL